MQFSQTLTKVTNSITNCDKYPIWYTCFTPMTRKKVRMVILSNVANFFNGMATAWAFAAVDSLNRADWLDLLYALFLAILSFSASILSGLQREYDKRP